LKYVIKVVEFSNGLPCPIAGQWLHSFDFEHSEGRGFGVFTKDITEAKTFESLEAALKFWNTVSAVNPLRPDGRPNKPLTATTCEIEKV
jgi:hypothetical protein